MDAIQPLRLGRLLWQVMKPGDLRGDELDAALAAYEVVWRHAQGTSGLSDYLAKAGEDVASAAAGVAARLGSNEERLRAALLGLRAPRAP